MTYQTTTYNNGKNPNTGKAWNCSHCGATNSKHATICGCAKSREGTDRETKPTTIEQLDAITLEW